MSAALMLQGTGSDVGKSVLTAGLCRVFTRRGLSVRPFKPQNMSNNAAIAGTGNEIGRAQALQARACGVPPSVDMNPVLLKPQTDIGAQIVVRGKVVGTARAADYQQYKAKLLPVVLDSFDNLRRDADLVIVEGAGSPAEINLRDRDIANMGFATAAQVPVVLVGDIDRGGVIASIVGTEGLISARDRSMLKGFIINKFRGDLKLFDEGIVAIVDKTRLENFGVLPFLGAVRQLPSEDSVGADRLNSDNRSQIEIAVPMVSRMSNFDDLDPLAAEASVSVRFVPPGMALPANIDLVVLPGTKSTVGDLAFLREQGWDIDLLAHHRRGGAILGICGGYQLLGKTVTDPEGVEGAPGSAEGLGLLDVRTRIDGSKQLTEVSGSEVASGAPVHGYEMHIGQTNGPDTARPMLWLDGRGDGAVSEDGLVSGCYLHGLFANDAFRTAFLSRMDQSHRTKLRYDALVDATLDELADHIELHLAVDRLLELAQAGR